MLLPTPAWATLYPQQMFDGCEGYDGQIGNGSLVTRSELTKADGDVKGSTTFIRSGRRSCAFAESGYGAQDNIAVMEWTSCGTPSELGHPACVFPGDRPNKAQQFAFAVWITGLPTAATSSWLVYQGDRNCEISPNTCGSNDARNWTDGVNWVKYNLDSSGILSITAHDAANGALSGTGTCSASHAIPTDAWVDISVQFLANTPLSSQEEVKVRIERAGPTLPFVDSTIDCIFTAGSAPTGNIWFGWDKSVAGAGPTTSGMFMDDFEFNQSTVANSEFLLPLRVYWIGSASTGDADTVLAEDSVDNLWPGCVGEVTCDTAGKLDAVSQVPAINTKYICSCVDPTTLTCGKCDAAVTQSFTLPTTNATAIGNSTTGIPATLTDYPNNGEGPLAVVKSVAVLAGPQSGPKVTVGIKDGSVPCGTGLLSMEGPLPSNGLSFAYTRTRDDSLSYKNSCDSSIPFDCSPTTTHCRNNAADYAHQLEVSVSRSGSLGSSHLLKQIYFEAGYIKPTLVPPTPTNTGIPTRTPKPTNTPSETYTPLVTNTPTRTFTVTRTPTSTRTTTSGATKTPSPTFAATKPVEARQWTSNCQQTQCQFCSKSQDDPRISLAQAEAQSSVCPSGVTYVIDQDMTIGGLPLFSNLTIECRDERRITSSGGGPLLHIDTATARGIRIKGPCLWDGTAIASAVSIFDFTGVSDLHVEGQQLLCKDQVGITYGGSGAENITLDKNVIRSTSASCRPYNDNGAVNVRRNDSAAPQLTPTATPT